MRVRLSSKGQLVIPRNIRQQLGLESGQEIEVQVVDHKIVLEPVFQATLIDSLYGCLAGHDFLSELEAEHREEIEREDRLHP